MFQGPLHDWVGEHRRKECMHAIYPAVRLIVERAHLAGWSREEILLAIADAADEDLADATDSSRVTFIDNDNQLAGSRDEPAPKRRPLEGRPIAASR